MNSTAYRNAHGVELKPGNWFLGADEYGRKEGIIDRVVQRGQIVEINGGPSVVYKSAPGEYAVQSILADNVYQTLGPMTIEGDGTVKQNPSDTRRPQIQNVSYWRKTIPQLEYIMLDAGVAARAMRGHSPAAEAKYLDQVNDAATVLFHRRGMPLQRNPLTRVKVKSPAQRGGGEPSPRLTKRRKTTQKAPPGFYANPTPRLKRADQPSQREHFNVKTGKMTKRASPRLKERRALTHYADTPGVWANPAPPMKYGFDVYDADRGTYTVYDKRKGKFFETARFKDFAKAKEYAQAYADANNCQVKITGNLSHPTIKRRP